MRLEIRVQLFRYKLPDYSLAAIEYARKLSRQIFQRLGVEDYTSYNPLDYGYINYNGDGYAIRAAITLRAPTSWEARRTTRSSIHFRSPESPEPLPRGSGQYAYH